MIYTTYYKIFAYKSYKRSIMKSSISPAKTMFILLMAVSQISCSEYAEDIVLESELFENTIIEEVEETETEETAIKTAAFTVLINGELFTANQIEAKLEEDKIYIMAKSKDGLDAVYLTFAIIEGKTLVFGTTNTNEELNNAGYMALSEDKTYITTAMYQKCGEVVLENWDAQQLTFSGTFHFNACDQEDTIFSLNDGLFENIQISQE